MQRTLMIIYLSILISEGYSQDVVVPQQDSLISRYAILRVNWDTKNIYIHYQDAEKKDYKTTFGPFLSTLAYDEEMNILMEKFSYLNKEGYTLINSFERNKMNFFVFIKSVKI
jgi:hypothetical protein